VNGEIAKRGGMVFIYGKMETSMKENGKTVWNMGTVLIYLETVIAIKDNTNLESQMVLVSINGAMEAFILEISAMVWSMEKANGGKIIYQTATHMKEITNWIKSMATVFLVGKAEMFTKEIMKKICDRGMGRCIGLMDLSTKVNGIKAFKMAMVF
jgi:hypothetical protein